MNYCRTCKHWSVNAHTIGLGTCTNIDAHLRREYWSGFLKVAQDYGCVCHEEGECTAKLFSDVEHSRITAEWEEALEEKLRAYAKSAEAANFEERGKQILQGMQAPLLDE